MTTATPTMTKAASGFRKVALSRALVAPALIFSIALTQIPFLVTIYFSLMRWNLLQPREKGFAGFENYIYVFKTGDLFPAIKATVGLTAISVVSSLLVGLVFAIYCQNLDYHPIFNHACSLCADLEVLDV
jgi:sorbitol/mannitol transport system permease protein